jgi:hypothetical protein
VDDHQPTLTCLKSHHSGGQDDSLQTTTAQTTCFFMHTPECFQGMHLEKIGPAKQNTAVKVPSSFNML